MLSFNYQNFCTDVMVVYGGKMERSATVLATQIKVELVLVSGENLEYGDLHKTITDNNIRLK